MDFDLFLEHHKEILPIFDIQGFLDTINSMIINSEYTKKYVNYYGSLVNINTEFSVILSISEEGNKENHIQIIRSFVRGYPEGTQNNTSKETLLWLKKITNDNSIDRYLRKIPSKYHKGLCWKPKIFDDDL